MARWAEVMVKDERIEILSGRDPFGMGMGGGVVETRYSPAQGGWVIDYKTSWGKLKASYPLKPGIRYRITRSEVRRVTSPELEIDPVVRGVRMLGYSPSIIVRHQSGEVSTFRVGFVSVQRGADQVYSNSLCVWTSFRVQTGQRVEGTNLYTKEVTWSPGYLAIEVGYGGGRAPVFHVCGIVNHQTVRELVMRAFPHDQNAQNV